MVINVVIWPGRLQILQLDDLLEEPEAQESSATMTGSEDKRLYHPDRKTLRNTHNFSF